MDAAITVDGVSKKFRLYDERNQSLKAAVLRGRRARYREFDALHDVSFEIPEGATFGLIGENGSGKSTLLKCIARILRPEQGQIRTRGKISALLELGAGSFHPEALGRENVYLNGAILGMSKKQIDARFDEIVAFAGFEEFIDSPVKNYSSGMYVRLGFSVAINVDPDILLVDEVLAVGDESFQRKCGEKFADFKASGKTVVVSHALATMRPLCDSLALLEHGKLVTVGPSAQVIDTYLDDVHTDRIPDGTHGVRWGTGQGSIDEIELFDALGTSVTSVRTGDAVTIRLRYSLRETIEKPVFAVSVHTVSGVGVSGPSTREVNYVPDRLQGEGVVELHIPRLMLVPGTYDLGCSLDEFSGAYAYDHRDRALRFDVEHGDPEEFAGIVALGGTWSGLDVNGRP